LKKKRSNRAHEVTKVMAGIGIVAVFLMIFVTVSRDEE
jgi:hypothetical protein